MFDGLIRLIETILRLDKGKILPFALVLVIIFAVGVPIIKNTFFRYTELDAEVRILGELAKIDYSKISDERLKDSYASILDRFKEIRTKKIVSVQIVYDEIKHNIWKFLSGAAIWIIMLFASLFIKGEKLISRFGDVFLCLLLGGAAGYIGVIIPSFNPILINYIGFPIVEIFVIFLFVNIFPDAPPKAK